MPKRELTEEEQALRTGLGAAIRVASGNKGLKPGDLAKAAGVALSQQYRIENGELTADFLYLVKISRLLGISIDALLKQAQVGMAQAAPTASIAVRIGNMTQRADQPGAVQVGYAGGSVTTVVGASAKKSRRKPG